MDNTTGKTKVIQVFGDPGHAWARVHIKDLVKLDIAHKITPYSYIRGLYAYLEEDCDLGVLVTALKARGITPKFKESHTDKRSKIRSYCSYRVIS